MTPEQRAEFMPQEEVALVRRAYDKDTDDSPRDGYVVRLCDSHEAVYKALEAAEKLNAELNAVYTECRNSASTYAAEMAGKLEAGEQREKALREALAPFAGPVADAVKRRDFAVMQERIKDWFGPSDFIKAREALARSQ